jgi:restriction endonuclease S subunit
MKDVDLWAGINWDTVVETPPHTTIALDWVKSGDILLISRGLSTYAIYVDQIPFERVLAAPHFYLITVQSSLVNPEFLAWQINQKSCQDYLRRTSEGSTTKSIRRDIADNIPVVIPPLDEQEKIVNIYRCIISERLLAKRLIENGERLMTGLAIKTLNSPS